MSPRKCWPPLAPRARSMLDRLRLDLADQIRTERRRRGWSIAHLAAQAGVSAGMVQGIEGGEPSTLEGYVRLAAALGFQPEFLLRAGRAAAAGRLADPVHSVMGEIEAQEIRRPPLEIRLDEPYRHYQFAGRADLVAIDRARRALLHIENRTRFPDVQEFAGSWNAKRAYLAEDLARRLEIRGGFTSISHVVVALWSAEVLHVLRLRMASFESLAPDPPTAFEAWWSGSVPGPGVSASLVIFDPLPGARRIRRRFVGLDAVRSVEPRYRDYAAAADALRRTGRA